MPTLHRGEKNEKRTLVRPVPLCLSCDVLVRVAGRAAHTRRSAATPHGSCCHPLLALRAAGVAPTRAAPARAGPGAGVAAPSCRSTAGASDTKREHQQRRTRSGGGAPRPRHRAPSPSSSHQPPPLSWFDRVWAPTPPVQHAPTRAPGGAPAHRPPSPRCRGSHPHRRIARTTVRATDLS